ncbi:MAG: hypothetical protein GY749_41800 [Desulfobacteraceae bacterium]|nr:hypothetical protein [Desulfobacteraceae bacterium]
MLRYLCDLTENQCRKPLLGSGVAVPIPFGLVAVSGDILLGTDGLFKYSLTRDITNALKGENLNQCGETLIGQVRLPSGSFQDDVSVVLCRY